MNMNNMNLSKVPAVYKNKSQENKVAKMRFQLLTAASMKMTVFWDVALCSLVEIY
jgi:hypothetical protein